MRKVAIFMIIMICLGLSVPAYATRRRYIEKQANEEEAVVGTSIDYRNHMYVDGLPGPSAFNPKDLEGYTYDGIPIKVPNFGNHKEYEVDQIKNFSDAIIDFLGWDAMLGVADYDLEENKLMFEPIKGVDSNANNTIGYGRRKFGEEPIEFKARIVDESSSDSTFSNWVGISFRTTTTQAPQWRDNPGYLFVIKSDVIELQRWLPDQKMLLIIDNTYVFNNEFHEFLINTEYVDDGFELSLSIDGQEVISFVDDHDEIPEEGYVTFYCSVDRVEIMPVNPTLISTNSEADKISDDRITALKVGESKALFAGISSQIDEEDEKVVPKIVNTRAFVPIRFVVDALGGEVQWDEELQTARITYRMNEVSITEGFAEYGLNGLFHKLDAPPYIENSRLFVPLRAIAEAFNKNVIWTEEEIIFILEQEEELSDETKENIFDFFN